jgi:G3E family GTPase
MHQIRYIMIGGFLGAGKTTTLARLARHYTAQGLNVGIVTNDQASDLVDTNLLRSLGFDVGEVAGACFCCSFDDLMSTVRSLGTRQRPDVILAEPVGSCTDLVATVIQPIRQLFDAEFRIAPYAVILKPSHGKRILQQHRSAGFSPKAAYIFTKQIEEADLVLVNRIDELSDAEADELESLVRQHVPDTPVLRISAKTGFGFHELTEWLGRNGQYGRRLLDIDYDTYAQGEAELGWLNSSLRVHSDCEFDLDALLLQIIERLKQELESASVETAHLKAIGLWEGFFGVANLVSRDSPAELSLPSNCSAGSADVIVNARVACDPDELQSIVLSIVSEVVESRGATAEFRNTQSFRPGRPVPTHRVTELTD